METLDNGALISPYLSTGWHMRRMKSESDRVIKAPISFLY